MMEDMNKVAIVIAKAPALVKVFAAMAIVFGMLKLLDSLPACQQAPIWNIVWTMGGIAFMWIVAIGLLLMKRWSIVVYFIGFALNWALSFAIYPVEQALRLYLEPGLTAAYITGILLPPILMIVVTALYWRRMK